MCPVMRMYLVLERREALNTCDSCAPDETPFPKWRSKRDAPPKAPVGVSAGAPCPMAQYEARSCNTAHAVIITVHSSVETAEASPARTPVHQLLSRRESFKQRFKAHAVASKGSLAVFMVLSSALCLLYIALLLGIVDVDTVIKTTHVAAFLFFYAGTGCVLSRVGSWINRM